MEKVYSVRKSVCRASEDQWFRIERICVRGIFRASPEDVFESIGYFSHIAEDLTPEEKDFFRKMENLNNV